MNETQNKPIETRERLGKVMYRIRRDHGLRQKVAAGLMGIHPDTLRRFEKGKQIPRPADIQKFCEATQVSEPEARELSRLYLAVGTGAAAIKDTQGVGASQVFQSLYPILYAALTPISGAYDRQSEKCAAFAEAYAGLSGKRVLDTGCGYGNTTVAISAYMPREIVAVDRSEGMLQLLRQVLQTSSDLSIWFGANGGDELLGELYHRTLMYLRWMRATFQESLFCRRGGLLRPLLRDILDIHTGDLGQVDVVVANNFFHWPVNERRDAITKAGHQLTSDQVLAQACHDALWPLASLLPPGGFAVLMEPKSFITLDDDPELDAEMEQKTLTEHPVYIAFHKTMQRIFKDDFGIEYELPRKTELFRRSRLPDLVQQGGFRLKNLHRADVTFMGDPLSFCFAQFPLLLGSIDLDFYEKLAVGRRVQKELAATLPDGVAQIPIREQQFYLILERI